jgi:hypothetical protein
MAEKQPSNNKERDVGRIVAYLTSTFNSATSEHPRAQRDKSGKPNQLYLWQCEFAYRLNEVVMGPACLLQSSIAKCNEMIDEVMATRKT